MRNVSFQTRLIAAFMLVISVVLSAILVSSSLFIRDRMLTEKQQQLTEKGIELAKKVAAFKERSSSLVNLRGILSDMDIFLDSRIWILDAERQPVAFSGGMHQGGGQHSPGMGGRGSGMGRKAMLGTPLTPGAMQGTMKTLLAELDPVYRGEIWSKVIEHPYYEERMVVVAIPIVRNSGEIDGAVMINSPVVAVNDFLRHIFVFIALGGIAGIILSFLSVRFLTRGLVRPLRSMQETTGAIARGEYGARVTVESTDEVGQLGDSINQLAQDLGQFMLEAGKTEKLRRDFIANVSHELRTPLSVIRGYSEAIVDGTMTDEKQTGNSLRLIRDEAVRLERLIKSLLELSRLQSASAPCPFESVSLPDIADHVLKLLLPLADSRHIEVNFATEPGLPPILGNQDRLIQLLLILLDNAIKYTPPNGVVSLTFRQDGPRAVVCSVQDTGVGIPAEDLPFVWERFYKVDKAHQHEDGGAGLGLAIARQIIDLHKANVQVTSELGVGTRIDLEFQTVAAAGPVHVQQSQ